MLNQHPITPPSEVLDEWLMDPALGNWQAIAIQAAQWGADQELEACINYFYEYERQRWGENSKLITGLRAARRPKPPALKEQAGDLAVIEATLSALRRAGLDAVHENTIRRALKALPND
jgi:hypothetical protein